MLSKIENINITTYEYKNGTMIEIVEKDDSFEAWIYDENYGVKDLMWGEPIHNTRFGKPYVQTYENFVKLVEENIEEYIEDYYDLANGF